MPPSAPDMLTTSSTGGPSSPKQGSIAWFVVLVLAFAGLQRLPSLLERFGTSAPAWLDDVAQLVGGGFAPLWAMLLVGGASLGWPALRHLLGHSVRVRVNAKLYVAALVVPIVVVGVAVLASGTRPGGIEAEPLALAGQVLVLAPLFALAEQLGWRAWLQRRLQAHLSPWLAGVMVGLVWVGHHLPLFATDSPTLHSELPLGGFLVLATVFSVLLAALFNAAGGSVVPVVVAHVAWNVAMQLALPADLGGSTPLMLVAATLFAAVGVAVAWWSRARATEQRPAIL